MDIDDVSKKIDDAVINFFKNIFNKKDDKSKNKKMGKSIIITSIIILLSNILIFGSFTIIGGGERGVIFSATNGVSEKVMGEGFNFKVPIVDEVIKFDVKTQKSEIQTSSTSQDQQIVQVKIALNYKLNSESVNKLYQEVGTDYLNRIITPTLEGSIKSVMAQYKAEELITKREEVAFNIETNVKDKLADKYIIVEDLNIVNMEFSETYNIAIEAKVTAEQEALKAKNELEKTKIEAEQTVVKANATRTKSILEAQATAETIKLKAEAEAEAIKIKQEALQQSKEVLSYKWIETWDGVLPTYYGGNENLLLTMNQS